MNTDSEPTEFETGYVLKILHKCVQKKLDEVTG
jgi:hypothetical protein